ncbi:DEAD/DEAH box helicase family protein [Rubripirellula amarantea]|nr:DEAD/DEAH box helicase family protein [Rubripirellula amarantea]
MNHSGIMFRPDRLQNLAPGLGGTLDAFLKVCQVQPRPYQSRIISEVLQQFGQTGRLPSERPLSSVLIESPTGSGKTVMGLASAAMIQQLTGARVGWVAMRRNLLAQAQAENVARRFGVRMELISMFDKDPPMVDLLIVDEAQHDAATSMANLHSKIQPTWTLGLSATPFRSDRVKLCFDHVIRDAGIAMLIADGYLSAYDHYTIDQYSPEGVGKLLIDEPCKWGKSLVFFHRREQCLGLQQILSDAGIESEVVMATSDRDRQLDDFAAGRIEILINMAILTEGFDCPELKTVFCRPSGKGCTIQMAGRVLRTCRDVPRKQVVQCKSTAHPMMRTAKPREQYLWTDAGWRSIQTNANLDAMTMVARRRVARADVALPSVVAMHRGRRSAFWQRDAS